MTPFTSTGFGRALRRGACVILALLATAVASAAGPRPIVSLAPAGELSGHAIEALERPGDVAVDHRGDIVIADAGAHRVIIVDPAGDTVTEFGGYGWEEGRFDGPSDVAIYPGFYVYVLDRGNRRVQRFDAEGDFVDLPIAEDEAGSPTGIEVGPSGELLVVDEDSQVVRVFSQFDEALEPIGHFGAEMGGLVAPAAIAVGPSREIAVGDPGRAAVEIFDEFGSHLRTLTAPDTLAPSALAFDREGNLLVADVYRGRVLSYSRGSARSTASIGRDALGVAFDPAGLVFDGRGDLLVLDAGGGRLLRIRVEYGDDATRG